MSQPNQGRLVTFEDELTTAVRDAVERARTVRQTSADSIEALLAPQYRGSAPRRIEGYLRHRAGEWVDGEEIAAVAGIAAWSRRIRELRDSGLHLEQSGGRYRLFT